MTKALCFHRRDLLALVMAAACLELCAGCDSHPAAVDASSAVTASARPTETPKTTAESAVPDGTEDGNAFATTGPLVAEQQADVAAERAGRIVRIAVQIGDRVNKGQILAELDDRELRTIYESRKAHLASIRAQFLEWQAEQRTAEADLRRADAMRADKIISEETWEHAKYRVDETIDEVDRYREESASAQADLNTAEVQLEQSRIVAPFAGVVGRSSVRPAQEVKPGDVLFWITAEAPLRVLFTVPETTMSQFSAGKTLDLTTQDYPGLHQQARIVRLSPVIDPASGSVQVIGAVVHPSPLLKPGMTMQVHLAK